MDQLLSEMEDLTTAIARLVVNIKVLLNSSSTLPMPPQLTESLEILISQQFPSTCSHLTSALSHLRDYRGIKVEVESDLEFETDDTNWIFNTGNLDSDEIKSEPELEFARNTRSKSVNKSEKSDLHKNTASKLNASDDDTESANFLAQNNKSDQDDEEFAALKPRPKKRKKLSTKTHKNSQNHTTQPGTKKPPLLCPTCGQTYKKKYNLDRHVAMAHANESSYPCDLCPKTFKWTEALRRHKVVAHNLLPRVMCSQCGAWFKHMEGLKRHVKSVHQEVRPHECDLCQKRFKLKTHLQYHLKTHQGSGGRSRGLNHERKNDRPVRCNFSND